MTTLSPNADNPKLLSSLNLAFVGDGVYELLVRQHLARLGSMPMGRLHRMAVAMVCAEAQSAAAQLLLPLLTPEEEAVYRRGRNSSSAGVPRHSDPAHYRRATGVEALFGWLYLAEKTQRINELFAIIVADEENL